MGSDASNLRLESLTRLRLEGFGDIGPLLSCCPNLAELDFGTWNGFRFKDVAAFTKCLHLVPELVSLSLSPAELDFEGWDWRILSQIGQTLPHLQELNLQTIGFSFSRRDSGSLRSIWFEKDPYEVVFWIRCDQREF
jgi:hypothetical protein